MIARDAGYDGSLLDSVTSEGTSDGIVSYGYNSDLRPSSRSINGGSATNYSYDNDGQLTAAGPLTLSFDPTNGYLISSSVGGATPATTSHSYNTLGETSGQTASHGSTQIYSVSIERDKLGRIIEKTETVAGQTITYEYIYDSKGRLTDVKKDGAVTHHYTYDANGNRTGASDPSGSTTATYDAQDRMLTYGSNTYTYSAVGELQTKTTLGGTSSYDFDELGNLVKVTLANGTVIDYVIDGIGRRIAKKVNGVVVQKFLYGTGTRPVAELDASGNVVATFTYGTRSNVPDLVTKSSVTYRILTDHLGSPRVVMDSATGAIVQRLDFDAFGQITSDTNPGFQPFGFAGGLYDGDTGLTRFGARDYMPETGRWASKDPDGFRAGDSNLYAYATNDPLNFLDTTGTAPRTAEEGVAGAIDAGERATSGQSAGLASWCPSGIGARWGRYLDRINKCMDNYRFETDIYGQMIDVGLPVSPEGMAAFAAGTGGPGVLDRVSAMLSAEKAALSEPGYILSTAHLGRYAKVASFAAKGIWVVSAATTYVGVLGAGMWWGQAVYCQTTASFGNTV